MSIELAGSRVLVTGGAGFIGSFIVDQLLEAGADRITIVDDFAVNQPVLLPRARITRLGPAVVGTAAVFPKLRARLALSRAKMLARRAPARNASRSRTARLVWPVGITGS